ncbi:exodeoxyribonuclease V subunit alpha [Vibrio azureus]|uniref:RecBCD enzyme subunit RecD n=1 Tax=Vibrio azureus NBRC 104587 TaxID=1219077 RepID=U3AM95_9VIBR|nr:exodeoxyribonuclease V subunit alpha [Vibrio azureus]AUI86803.1 exodeoxyribonuclease V subunit alpha [Vibrio azureus]GAD74422.1 exodeoxyribonuclease V alpha chain [Vibrio azureus NBRC 104587]
MKSHDVLLEQGDLLTVLSHLVSRGGIRPVDEQFARFIYSQCQQQADGQPLALIAAVLSSELGKGHICLPLFDQQGQPTDLMSKLGLFGDAALALHTKLQSINWLELLQQSPLVGHAGEALPMMFDGQRLYLSRYWFYEVTLANKLNQLSEVSSLPASELSRLSELLNHLFARQYHFLFHALSALNETGSSHQVQRQQLVCDHLDIVDETQLDWIAIDQAVSQCRHVQDLQVLDDLVPLAVCVNWQKVAAAVALTRRFAVISGGPGTGKTTTVTKLLAALIEQAGTEKNITIKLVAPTGKAAARLTESIGKAVQALPVDPDLKAKIPTESSTLHRLLGAIPNSVEFRHNKQNPLHLDILVIDEASMVDLPMMYKVVESLPKHARLILLGDKDQLASVEAGAVLGDICSFYAFGYSKEQAKAVAKLTGFTTLSHSSTHKVLIADSLCMLQKSYRFDARSGIGQLAKAVNAGSAAQVDHVFNQDFADIEQFALSSQHYNQMMQTLVKEYGHYLKRINHHYNHPETGHPESVSDKAKAVLEAFNRCRLLCAVREGDFGVAGLNQRVEKALAARKLIQTQDELWYHGRPVMVTRNDHSLGLYNGDIGICMLDDREEEQRLKVFFELPDGSVKSVLPSRVPEHDTAYAMTIHKSQGSEFEFTLMILPPTYSPILTRELIYTGITRAKKRLAMYTDMNILKRGIKIKTSRASGLVSRLSP